MSVIDKLVKNDIKLPSPPAIAIRILEEVKKDDAGYDGLAQIISSDPSLVAKTLKVVNSSFYALPQKVGNLEKAIAILGLNAMKNIALSFVVTNEFRSHATDGFDFDFFWKRSVTAAVAADLTASFIGNKYEDAFVAGLLQDIGIAVLYLSQKNDYLKVFDEKTAENLSVDLAEKKIFGFDHQELGSEMLAEWGLSEDIYMPIRFHHKKKAPSGEDELNINTLYLSDKISSVYHGSHSSDKIESIKGILGTKYGKSPEEIQNLIDLVASRSLEIFSVFEIDPADMKPYSQILQEVNAALGKLNLSNEQLLLKYKELKDRAEALAGQLKVTNERLRSIALRDGLTGLYNHRYFQEVLDKELGRAMRYRRAFSLVLFDLDYFKKINDSYGHRAGDIVLKEISAVVMNNVRTNDIVARYGGEEFVIIAPETDLKGVAVLAERIRRAVEQMQIQVDAITVQVTISVGAATYLPGTEGTTKTKLLDAADAAMYQAKNNGRNQLAMAKVGGK